MVSRNRFNQKTSRLKEKSVFDVFNILFLGVLGLSMLFPIVNLIYISFSDITDVVGGGFRILPKSFNLDAYKYILKFSSLWTAYRNTVFLTVVGTGINLVMSTLAAYVLSRRDLPGRNAMTTIVLITMFFSGGLIPSFLLVNSLRMVDTLWALMIPGAISSWNMIIMRNYFQSLPVSLRESAQIDGAGEFRTLLTIVLPLSLPILATMALFYGVGHWNQYSGAVIYINDPQKYTLQVVIRQMYVQSITELEADSLPPPVDTVRAAAVVLAVIPIMLVYPFLQKYFVKGIMIGAIKG